MAPWLIAVQWGSRLILVVLVLLSIWSVAIMVDRRKVFRRLDGEGKFDEALALIRGRDWKGLATWLGSRDGIRARTLKAAVETGSHEPEAIERAVKSYLVQERTGLEEGLTALATMGSNAPFIGLFGTVLGIIQAFGALAASSGNTASVMTGISEALVATAVGLLVAIPAVIAYNVFTRRMRLILTDCESLRDLYISRRLIDPGSAREASGSRGGG